MFVGMFLGLFWWWRIGRDEHLDEVKLFDMGFMAMMSFIIVGRLGYVLTRWGELSGIWQAIAMFAYPGFVFWLGSVGAFASLVIGAKAKSWDEWKALDIFAVSTSVVMIFASIGGLLNGSNPGIEVARYGMRYPGVDGLVFPVDLLGIVWFVLLFLVVSRVRKNFRFYQWYKVEQSKVSNGLAFLTYLAMIGMYYALRSMVDDVKLHLAGIPVMLLIGVGVFVFSLIMIYIRSGRKINDDFNLIKIWLKKDKKLNIKKGIKVKK